MKNKFLIVKLQTWILFLKRSLPIMLNIDSARSPGSKKYMIQKKSLCLSTLNRKSHGCLVGIPSCLLLGGISPSTEMSSSFNASSTSMHENLAKRCPDFMDWRRKRRKIQNCFLGILLMTFPLGLISHRFYCLLIVST